MIETEMTTGRVRYLLMNNKIIRSNIFRQRQQIYRIETEAEIIEAKSTSATDYSRDKVQKTPEPQEISMADVRRERYLQKTAIGTREMLINGQEREIEHLDLCVLRLPAIEQCVTLSRYYDQDTAEETAQKLQELKNLQTPYTPRHVDRYAHDAIQMIADMFNLHESENQDVPDNLIAAGEYDESMEILFDNVMSANV